MRTALVLLFLLALASVPGSLIPQRSVNPVEVAEFIRANPTLATWYERLGLFDVFSSPWFAAIYLALMVSLLGCVIPRSVQHWRLVRSRPPAAPRHLDRLPAYRTWVTEAAPGDVTERATQELRRSGYRVEPRAGVSVAAERGYLREVGNLGFHLALVAVLIAVAVGNLFGFRGTVLVVEGNGFANTVTQYDGYQAGRLFDESQLPPFALTVEDFHVRFETQGEQRGSVREFAAKVSYTTEPGAPEQTYNLRVNHPLQVDGSQVHLLGHGYAPRFTVRDGRGDVAFSGPVPFLPQDGRFSSTGVIKVPDARPEQLGFQGFFLPTAVIDPQRGPVSAFPDALRPAVYLTAYHGDLGLDSGVPQSVYRLDMRGLKQFRTASGDAFRVALTPGQEVTLPGGAGTISFDGYARWVNLQISRNPGEPIALAAAGLALGGLLLSLVVRRRRVWVRATAARGRTVVEVAGLDRSDPTLAPRRDRAAPTDARNDLATEIDTLATALAQHAPPVREEPGCS
jgi:cytochrome c biogenesis protein